MNNKLSNLTVNILTHRTNTKILTDCVKSISKDVAINIIENSIIESLLSHGIKTKSDRKNIYNCQKDIELHLLHMTTESDETFLSYSDDIDEMIKSLYSSDNIY